MNPVYVTDDVWIALISTLGLIVVAVIGNGLLANRSRQHAKAAREQVENSHDTNLRDDIDTKHESNVKRLREIDNLVLWQAEHQSVSEKGFRRVLRLELVVIPLLAAIAAGIIHNRMKGTP